MGFRKKKYYRAGEDSVSDSDSCQLIFIAQQAQHEQGMGIKIKFIHQISLFFRCMDIQDMGQIGIIAVRCQLSGSPDRGLGMVDVPFGRKAVSCDSRVPKADPVFLSPFWGNARNTVSTFSMVSSV